MTLFPQLSPNGDRLRRGGTGVRHLGRDAKLRQNILDNQTVGWKSGRRQRLPAGSVEKFYNQARPETSQPLKDEHIWLICKEIRACGMEIAKVLANNKKGAWGRRQSDRNTEKLDNLVAKVLSQ